MLSVEFFIIIMLNAAILSVIMLSVVAPLHTQWLQLGL
jgi:hypothetical protein